MPLVLRHECVLLEMFYVFVIGFGVVRLMLIPVHAVLRHECVLPEMFVLRYIRHGVWDIVRFTLTCILDGTGMCLNTMNLF